MNRPVPWNRPKPQPGQFSRLTDSKRHWFPVFPPLRLCASARVPALAFSNLKSASEIKRSVVRTLRSRRLPKPADGVMLRTDLKREGRGVRGEVFRPPRSPRAPRFHLLGLIHHRQAPDRGWLHAPRHALRLI